MAKGDATGGTPQVQPKIDQYSVMHKLMDALGGNQPAQNLAPSPDMAQPMNGNQPSFLPGDQFNPQPKPMGGRFQPLQNGAPQVGAMNGGSIAPSNPQDIIRKNMIGTRTFGGV